MQAFLKTIRWSVGLLFIFSGLIKANDPLGLSYKMQEFFEVWGLAFLDDYTLAFALIMNTFEIVAGVALLIKFPYKQTLWLLLGLIVFFTFLTGYTLFSGKIKTCGCFGDCIPLTPKVSFIKDLVLLFAILILLFNHKKVKSNLHKALGIFLLILSTGIVGYGQYYVLQHLPFIDCLPYKRGNDIKEQMKVPEGAVPDSVSIQMSFNKNGKTIKFDINQFPADFDSTYVYQDRKEVLIQKGNGKVAKIVDFSLFTMNNIDTTNALFNSTAPYVLLFSGKIDRSISWKALITKIKKKHQQVYLITADKANAAQLNLDIPILIGDMTMIKTAARVWPTVTIMNGSTIMEKQSYVDFLKK
ncbi:MAG: BT_3928 family protein [Chitinophagia bacterium]